MSLSALLAGSNGDVPNRSREPPAARRVFRQDCFAPCRKANLSIGGVTSVVMMMTMTRGVNKAGRTAPLQSGGGDDEGNLAAGYHPRPDAERRCGGRSPSCAPQHAAEQLGGNRDKRK